MRIQPENNRPVELSYIDLCTGLLNDIKSDRCMTQRDKNDATVLMKRVAEILEKYSA